MPNPTQKPWTFMVYMAGDNNLDPNGIIDLKEMKRVGTNADINVVAQFDSESANHWTTRYLLTKGSNLAADVVGTLGNTKRDLQLDLFLNLGSHLFFRRE